VEVIASSVLAGNQIDHYSLGNLVATSATASTYRGTDLRTGRPVAIKILRREIAVDLLLVKRFQREQDIGQQLNHPCVVKFVKDDARSAPYLVTEWVEGQPLRRVLSEEGRLPTERALRIAMGVCGALEYVHSQGVVHRDLKPENIMVGADDRITLMDFGVAGVDGARRLTFGEMSQIVGTADYISPEQVRGKRGDARSDIYALGVILYEMLTGTTPFPGDNPFVVMNNRLVNDPVPAREINPAISVELQEVLCRALERDPKHRYARAHELSWDLQHLDRVGAADRPELQNRRQRTHRIRVLLVYGTIAALFIFAFALLLYVARNG
jgi:serine/threonine protein kinase